MAEQQYNDPGTTASSIGAQARTDFYEKKAIIAVRDKQYFSPLASVKAMPKNMGKKIKQDVYVPLLDDRNVNDQGLDAAGLIITASKWQAFNAAGTEIVTFLDGDDYYYPKKLEYEYSLLQNSLNVQAAFSNFHYINERGEVTGRFAKENDTPATGDIFINTYTRDYHIS